MVRSFMKLLTDFVNLITVMVFHNCPSVAVNIFGVLLVGIVLHFLGLI